MRIILVAAACLGLAGCLGTGTGKKVAEAELPEGPSLNRSDCYTVVLYDKHDVKKPAKDVPPEHAAFLGKWSNGAWNGKWCHDLLVTEVRKDGTVEMVEMHAPYEPWNQPATAFKRTGRINDQGELRLAYGVEQVSYRIVDGRMIARRSGSLGNLEAELRKPGWAPQPVPRPAVVQAAKVATSG